MNPTDALDRLCASQGILTEYDDVWGRRHPVSDETKRTLLEAMGIQAQTALQVEEELDRNERAAWQHMLPPVVVAKVETPVRVELNVATTLANHTFIWELQHEDGTRQQGELVPQRLEKLDERRVGGTASTRYAFVLPAEPPAGYHDLLLRGSEKSAPAHMRLIVTPERCYQPPGLSDDARVWGVGVQIYSIRSQRNWGMGDFTDLRMLIDQSYELGADIIGVNPLHALFVHDPEHASPYSPSSRLFLNVLYIDVEAAADFNECEDARNAVQQPAFQAALRALRADDLVRYAAVAERKLPILEMLYRHFREHHLTAAGERGHAFRAYQLAQGKSLRMYATFEALQEHFRASDAKTWGWPVWPEAYRDPDSDAVAALAAEKEQRIEFFEYMQWLAEQQLASVRQRSSERGLAIGMYADLAVGVDSGGAEAWANQKCYALGARIGAPPDLFNMKGQDWGLPPLIPNRLFESAYASFIATLQCTMRHAGALRIDHVMGLLRLFCVPPGKSPTEGTYVMYPLHDLLGILALESQRNRCLVIGEDLGTVPDELRDALQPLGVLSYRLFYFEKDEAEHYKSPADFPRQALAAISTHDLPPLHGYWEGVDIERRWQLGLFPSEAERNQEIVARSQERARMLLALEREKLLPPGMSPDPISAPKMTKELMTALHVYLARSASQVMMIQPEDIFAQSEQINLPGTVDQHPNWRRKLALTLEAWSDDERVQLLTQTLNRERGRRKEETPAHMHAPHDLALGPPRATYRLQLHRGFTFAMATELVPYLASLGISHCYASPYLKARPGSQHGYDIIDHNDFNPEIGTAADFERFVKMLRRHEMSHILDMVPNHMGVMGSDNTWWLDVLENGPASTYADFFDIDWEARQGIYRHKVLLPVLGDHYGVVLERAELQLRFDCETGSFSVYYFEHRFPIDPREYPQILSQYADRLRARLGGDHSDVREYESLISAFRNLPSRSESAEDKLNERQRDKEIHKANFAALCRRSADISHLIDETVAAFNGTAGEATSFQSLHQLIQAQAYRLSSWRVASDEINYRRFFDVNDLAALRMENAKVFEHTHRLVGTLLNTGKVAGLRIDHPDGLYHPLQYFERLHGLTTPDKGSDSAGEVHRLPYLIVEKIVAHYERLPANWPVQGTTGYEFVNLLNRLFVDGEAEARLDRLYGAFLHERVDFNELLYNTKKLIMRVALASELGVLASQLRRIAQAEPRVCDFTLNSLRDALGELVACFPVYRTYVTEAGASEDDKRYIDWAISVAKRRSQAADISIFDFIRDILLTAAAEGKPEPHRRAIIAFAMKFQQYTGPVMAKGLEDTSFYRYNRLVSLNEVGGDPRHFAVSANDFHRANQERLQQFPHTMLATSTHDTKRSEDVRMRINVISESTDDWQKHLARWTRLNRGKKRVVDDKPAPSRNDEYLLYQTLVGAWPLGELDDAGLLAFAERIEAYMLKAIREAKVNTSWINPNKHYEDAVSEFVRALLKPSARNPFLADFVPFVKRLTPYGLLNGLSQTLLKFTVPGVPDIYQGNESWDFSLVDPDNRRPVDYALRQQRLAKLQSDFSNRLQRAEQLRQLMEHIESGDAKLFLTWRLLSLRREYPLLFQKGTYLPLSADGPRATHLCAFARNHNGATLIVLAPRLFARLTQGREQVAFSQVDWEDTRVEVPAPSGGRGYENWLTGEMLTPRQQNGRYWIAVKDALARFPVGALTN